MTTSRQRIPGPGAATRVTSSARGSSRRAGALALALLGLLVPAEAAPERPPPQGSPGEDAPIERWLEQLVEAEQRGGPASQSAVREGLALGPEAAARALSGGGEGFRGLDVEARRARAWLLLSAGDARAIEPALRLVDDPDPAVRTAVLAFLSAPELGRSELAARVERLGRLALEGAELAARAGALTALVRLDQAEATAELVRLEPRLGPEERALCASALAADPRARDHTVRMVQAAFAGGPTHGPREPRAPLDPSVLGPYLAAYGQRLAELPQGGTARADRVPFVLGARHPDPAVASRALAAIEAFELRCVRLGEAERAASCLRALLGEGGRAASGGPERATTQALARRLVRLGLTELEDPAPALADARALALAADGLEVGLEARLERAAGRLFEASALLALGRLDELEGALAEAEALLAGLASERLERSPSQRLVETAHEVELLRAAAALHRALAALAAGLEPSDPRVLVHARDAHERALAAQLAAYEGVASSRRRVLAMPAAHGLDELLAHPSSPVVLVLRNSRRARVAGKNALDLELALCSALASVAPFELPGVERFDSLERRFTSPLADPVRNHLLALIQSAFYRATETWIDRELERQFPDDEAQRERLRLFVATQVRLRQDSDASEGPRSRLRVRAQTGVAVTLAALQRVDGRFGAALALAERTVRDLQAPEALEVRPTSILQGDFDARELVEVDARLMVGDALMDLDQPDRAELELLAVIDRIDKLDEIQAGGRPGVTGADLFQLRAARIDALVSLAVNANVKQRDPRKARRYFEQAYEVGRSEFLQVLLACYRARDGDAAGARDALRDVTVSPDNHYNLACTHALLGETDTALDYLRRDLAEKRASPGGLARQIDWAREDPDLAALRSDPRFEALLEEAAGWAAAAGR